MMRVFLFLAFFLMMFGSAHAEVLRSSSFQVFDPVIGVSGDRSTSTNFTLFHSLFELGLGTSTATSFSLTPGFLAFPVVTLPSVTATAGDGEVDVSWTSASGKVGWTVSGYSVGRSTTSGGPYTYSSVGNVTSSTRTALANGTKYFFIVNPEDAFGNRIATSTEVSATPVAAPAEAAPAPSRRGGGGTLFPDGVGVPQEVEERGAEAVFRGLAPPFAELRLLQDAVITAETTAASDGRFELFARGLSDGTHSFLITGEDAFGRRIARASFTIVADRERAVAVQDILLSPTVATNVQDIRRGHPLTVEGASIPNASVTILLEHAFGEVGRVSKIVRTDTAGAYRVSLDTAELPLGAYVVRAFVSRDGNISRVSLPLDVSIGVVTVLREIVRCPLRGDLNGDCRVNLVDFSIAAYYRTNPFLAIAREKERAFLNGDGVVDLLDFSILAYHWTG